MFFARSALASAALLSFSATTQGWVLHRKTNEHAEVKRVIADGAQEGRAWNNFFGKRQDDVILDCPNNQFAALLNNNPDSRVQDFCNDWLNIAPATMTSEVTPTVTVTTSASTTTTQTNTERILTTTTVVETMTMSASATASVRRRMAAAAAQVESIASSIVESVMASGTPISEVATSSKPPNRILAEEGLATACSCKLVQPTATVTQLFTVPAITSTVGVRVLRIVQQTQTMTYTSTTTVAAAVVATSSASPVSSSADSVSSTADAMGASSAGSSSAASNDAEEPSSSPVVTAAPVVSTVFSESSTSTVADGTPVVTAIPFSCDDDATDKNVDQVFGGIRFGYSVYCNSALVSADRVGSLINVDTATSCAAQCSLLNAQGGPDSCQSALFTPYTDGRLGGNCALLSAAESTNVETVPAPGSVSIVHTGTFANGDECAALNATRADIDTSALVASITSAGVVVSTPGLVTQSSGGGVSRTYVSANSTDASGYIHWSWFELYASSASWYAVYETSWACSATITRTIEQQATTVIEGSTITAVAVTTIIGNGVTTIISGDSTTTIRGGAGGEGGSGPTFVPALTTSGDAGLTTIFSAATQTSTGADGIVTPAPSTPGGQGNVTVVEVFSTFFSTGTDGVIAPSVSVALVNGSVSLETIVFPTATTLTLSGANSTFYSAGTDGVLTPSVTQVLETIVSSGAATITVSGSNATAFSTGGDGVISPSPSADVVSSTDTEEWDTEFSYGPRPSVTSTSIVTFTSTGSNGIITPTIVTEVITTAAGSANFTFALSTATANSTGGDGVIPPGSTLVVTETSNVTLLVPSSTALAITFSGGNSFTESSVTGFTSSTGGSGVIPPAPSNGTVPFTPSFGEGDRTGQFSPPASTGTANSTSASGFTTPSSNVTITTTGSFSTLIVTATTNITLSLPTGNVTLIPPTTRPFDDNTTVPLVSINWSTVPSFPTGNITTILPPPTPTGNSTASFTPSFGEGDRTGSFSRTGSVLLSTGVSGSSNATTTPPPFATGNSTIPGGPTAPITEACPSPTVFSFITREVIITTYTVETIPVVAATCISLDAAPTAPADDDATEDSDDDATEDSDDDATEDSDDDATEDTASATSADNSGATATPQSRFRRSGTLATEDQIAAACADTSNLILSPTLNIQPDNSTEGWFVGPSDNTITVNSVVTDNGTIAQYRSAFPDHSVALVQPLTLCPGTQYELSGLTRTADTSSACTIEFIVGNDSVFEATPQTDWTSRTERFTAGPGPEGASVDLQVVGNCAGYFGAPVGADADGYMVVEVGAVSVTADPQ